MANNTVHMPVIHQSSRVTIICTQNKVSRIKASLSDSSYLAFNVVPGTTQTQHRTHPLTSTHHRVNFLSSFMIISWPTCNISMKCSPEVITSIMSTNCFASISRCSHFSKHLRITIDYTRKIHHLS